MFCPHCGKEIAEGQSFCQHCGGSLSTAAAPEMAVESTPTNGGREKTPWEDREARGYFTGLFKNLNGVLFHPSEFYKKMSVTGGLTDPLLYALIMGMAGLMVSVLWQISLKGAMQDMLPGMPASAGYEIFRGIGTAILAFLSPFLIIMGLFIASGILHVFLLMVNGAKKGYEATFRVVAYSYSANIFLVLPFCGQLIAALWIVVLYIIGLREGHEITGGKAAFAVFLPAIVCCGLIMVAVTLFMGAVAASFGAMMQMHK